jgi:hypothetical protein
MKDYDLDDFLKISALLNYQLSARQRNWNNVTSILLEGKSITPRHAEVLLHAFAYLGKIYGKKKRDLGPFSVLHPLRATALLSHASQEVDLLDVMTCLLHDHFEDFRPAKPENSTGGHPDPGFQLFLNGIPRSHRKGLTEHLTWLTKEPSETYNHYIGHLLDQARNAPEVVRVKLADRLDNTFDMRIDLQDPLQGVDFFEVIFQTFFTNIYKGYRPEQVHQTTLVLNGAQRLYQLFKNIVLMSLIRQRESAAEDPVSQRLFKALAKASMEEAQRITLHIFGYHETSVATLREILKETLAYAQSGGLEAVTLQKRGHRLDGLFMSVFDQPKRVIRNRQLATLYQNKPLMIEVAISFVIIFLSFLNDDRYFVHGISAEGIRPEPKSEKQDRRSIPAS